MNGVPGNLRVERPHAGAAVVVFDGEHDLATAADVRALLEALIQENELVVADFSVAEFVDSSTIATLLTCHQTAVARGSTFRLQLGTACIVDKAFEVTGVLNVVECLATREEALRRA